MAGSTIADLKSEWQHRYGRWRQRRVMTSRQASRSGQIGRPLVVGLMGTPSGLGTGARLLVQGLDACGLSPACLDVSALFDNHDGLLDPVSARPDDGCGPVIFHLNPYELQHVVAQDIVPHLAERYRVGVWAWEQPRLPRSWPPCAVWVDELWGSSTFLADLLQGVGGLDSHHIPYPLALPGAAEAPDAGEKKKDGTFRVLTAFSALSSLERKNPRGAVEAFLRAFPETRDASLTLHSPAPLDAATRRALCVDDRIELIEAPLTDAAVTDLFRSHHAFISLHRAEGFGLSIARALALGMPSVFTDHSGAADFASSPLAYGVGHGAVAVSRNNAQYRRAQGRWAEPDIAQAAQALCEIRSLDAAALSARQVDAAQWWQAHFGLARFRKNLSETGLARRLDAAL